MARRVALIPGDGIGPEVAEAARKVVDATGVEVAWTVVEAGADAAGPDGDPLPAGVLDAIRASEAALKGPITTPIGKGFASVNVRLRRELDLYASVRPVRSLPGVPTQHEKVDLVVVRENTEGLYSGIEHEIAPGVVEGFKVMTERACERITSFAFQLARRQGRRSVTVAHKTSVMRATDGMFVDAARRASKKYPDVEFREIVIDALCMELVLDPTAFDVIVLENLYGDIISDLTAGLVGGLGVVPGANHGDAVSVYEAVHGSAPDIAGMGLANPTALVLSAALMLEGLDEDAAAKRIREAVDTVLGAGEVRTSDLGGTASTSAFADALAQEVARGA